MSRIFGLGSPGFTFIERRKVEEPKRSDDTKKGNKENTNSFSDKKYSKRNESDNGYLCMIYSGGAILQTIKENRVGENIDTIL